MRTCQCAFCRAHGAVNISDPEGLVRINASNDDIIRYVFGLRTADFLICRHCGVYFAAVMGRQPKICSTINVAGLTMAEFHDISEQPMEYGAETIEQRVERRYQRWTPTEFSDETLNQSNFGPL